MALGNVTLYSGGKSGDVGSNPFVVASGTTASINAGEPVAKTLGNTTGKAVTSSATNTPVAATDFVAGISATTSTETASAAGSVVVFDVFDGHSTWLCAPNVAASWDTQAEYDALVGARVLFDKTGGVYTVLASDGATNGLVVEPLDISVFPGKVRFSFRNALAYFA